MFDSVSALEMDLRRFVADGYRLQWSFRFSSSDVGIALIRLASGKLVEDKPRHKDNSGLPPIDVRAAANRFVADVMLAPTSDHFTTLGVARDADSITMRENFRRLMALVHPDARPVGFPSDAASRVNRAYAVLADDEARAAYAASLATPDSAPMVVRSATGPARAQGKTSRPPRSGVSERLRGFAQLLRARHVLLWMAVLLLIPLGLGLSSLLPHDAPTRLVEARPKLNLSVDLEGALSSAVASGTDTSTRPATKTTQETAESVLPTDPKASPTSGRAQTARTPPTREVQAAPAVAMTSQLSARSVDIAARTTVAQSLAPVQGYSPTTPTAGDPAAASKIAAPDQANGSARAPESQPSLASSAGAGPASVVSQRPQAPERGESPSRTRTADAEDILVRFTNAYETGSIGGFGQLFSSSMVGRRQMLNDYERVFLATRQRSIKFNQLKHTASGDRVATSGYATVTTTDQENRVVTQRVFLEFEIGRERGEPRIERLANYVIN